MNATPELTNQSEHLSWLYRFLVILAAIYFFFTWAPQFFSSEFKPANISFPLKSTGADLLAVQVSAQRFAEGKSARFLGSSDGPEVFPYPIGNTFHAYGGLSVVGFLPFHKAPFERLRKVWFGVELAALFLLSLLTLRTKLDLSKTEHQLGFVLFYLMTLTLSGPLNLGLERGNIELIMPLGLFWVWRDWRSSSLSFLSSMVLSTLVHLKVWPMFLLSILTARKNWKYLMFSAALIVLIPIALNPWLPTQESLQALTSQGNATAQMLGWVNVSLYSLLRTLHLNLDWHWVSVFWLAGNGAFFFYLMNSSGLKPRTPSDLDLLFGAAICIALLSPACLFEYCLGAIIIVIPVAMNLRRKWIGETLLAGILSSFLVFQYYNGILKTLLILGLLGVLLLEYFESRIPKPNPLSK